MEKEGLLRSIQFLQQQDLTIDLLVTDRHRQIAKWIRESHPEITHRYDVWHVAKGMECINMCIHACMYINTLTTHILLQHIGVRKKLEALAKQKDCEIVGQWIKSIINHLYWCVSSTPSGDGDIIKAKWLSLNNHLHNIHRGHGIHFPNCLHTQLTGHAQKKKWFKRRKYL